MDLSVFSTGYRMSPSLMTPLPPLTLANTKAFQSYIISNPFLAFSFSSSGQEAFSSKLPSAFVWPLPLSFVLSLSRSSMLVT